MNVESLQDHLTAHVHGDAISRCQWWHAAALRCWEQRRVQLIMSRDGKDLYLARFWLTSPMALPAMGADRSTYESGNSLLLHYFARGDDDHALHDHPWDDFSTTVLAGGYTERRPAQPWRDANQPDAHRSPSTLGPRFTDCELLIRRPGGPRQFRRCFDQHAVEDVLPDTWTLVATGPRVRSWFFYPPDASAVPWRDFLAAKSAPGGALK